MHRLEIDHWQRGGPRTLSVQWAPPAGRLEPIGANRVFPTDPGVPRWFRGYVAALCAVGVLLWVQGKSAGRRVRPAGRWRPRPRVARLARPVRSLPVDRRGRPGDVLRKRGEPGGTGGKRAVDVTAGCRPVGADARAARRVEQRRGRCGSRLESGATGNLRAVTQPEHHPHRARHVPVAHFGRDPGRRPLHLRSRVVRIHFLPESPGRLSDHVGQRHRRHVRSWAGPVPPAQCPNRPGTRAIRKIAAANEARGRAPAPDKAVRCAGRFFWPRLETTRSSPHPR